MCLETIQSAEVQSMNTVPPKPAKISKEVCPSHQISCSPYTLPFYSVPSHWSVYKSYFTLSRHFQEHNRHAMSRYPENIVQFSEGEFVLKSCQMCASSLIRGRSNAKSQGLRPAPCLKQLTASTVVRSDGNFGTCVYGPFNILGALNGWS